jgi:hypothetical protein
MAVTGWLKMVRASTVFALGFVSAVPPKQCICPMSSCIMLSSHMHAAPACALTCHMSRVLAGFWGRSRWRAGQQQHCQGPGGLHTSAGGWQQHARAWLSQLKPVLSLVAMRSRHVVQMLLRSRNRLYRQLCAQPTAMKPRCMTCSAELVSHVSHVCS